MTTGHNVEQGDSANRFDEAEFVTAPEVDEATLMRLADLAETLNSVSEEIGDISIDLVRSAIEAGTDRPAADRQLAKARRAVDKAAFLLAGIEP